MLGVSPKLNFFQGFLVAEIKLIKFTWKQRLEKKCRNYPHEDFSSYREMKDTYNLMPFWAAMNEREVTTSTVAFFEWP